MKFSIDGKELNVSLEESLTLRALLDKSSEEITNKQRIVMGYEVNGQPFTGGEEELATLSVKDVETFNILTSPIRDIIINSMKAANSHLPQLIKGIEKSAYLLQNEQITEGMEVLQQVIAGLGGFIEIVDKSTQVVSTALAPSIMEELPIIEKRSEINQVLNKIVGHLNSGEFVEVSVILERDLVAVMADWIIFLPKIVEKIEISIN